MISELFNDYRCACGKLLLKGIFFDGILEIKCKRCGRINKIGRSKTIEDISHYLLFLNNQGLITNASDSACNILGYNYAELNGKIFTEIDRTISTPESIAPGMYTISAVFCDYKDLNQEVIASFHVAKRGNNVLNFLFIILGALGVIVFLMVIELYILIKKKSVA